MSASPKKVLVIAPHMDDEVLGMGATISKHVHSGHEVYVCFIAHRVYKRKYDKKRNQKEVKDALDAQKVLGYKESEFFNLNDERLDAAIQDILIPLEKYVEKVKPEIVYSNFYGDNHQDHRAVFQAVRIAIRPSAGVTPTKWFLYETPSSTEQSPPIIEGTFMPNYYVDVEGFLETKLKAYNCYETEKRELPNSRAPEALKALAVKRGVEAGLKCAEAFMLMRDKWV
jgi:LmbE family N-acetylglucosaminyl deacetylase